MASVKCPTCNRPVDYSPANKWRPFCSERCKLIDLGEWAAETHAIPGEGISEESSESTSQDNQKS